MAERSPEDGPHAEKEEEETKRKEAMRLPRKLDPMRRMMKFCAPKGNPMSGTPCKTGG